MEINIRDPDVDYKQLVGTTGECRDYGFMLNRIQWSSDAFKLCNQRLSELSGGPGVLTEVMDLLEDRRAIIEDNYYTQLDICGQSFSIFLKYASNADKKLAAQIRLDTFAFQDRYAWAHPDFGKTRFDKAMEAIAECPTPLKVFLASATVIILGVGTMLAGPGSAPLWAAAFKGALILGGVGMTAGAVYGGVTEGGEGAIKYGGTGLFLGTSLGASTGFSFAMTGALSTAGASTFAANAGGLLVRTSGGMLTSFVDELIDPMVKDDRLGKDFAKNTLISTGVSTTLDILGMGLFSRLAKGFNITSKALPEIDPRTLRIFEGAVKPADKFGQLEGEAFARMVLGPDFAYTETVRHVAFKAPWQVNPMESLGKFSYSLIMPSAGTTGGRIATTDDFGFKDIPDVFFFQPMLINTSKSSDDKKK